jgi:hypothetical protein
MNKKDKLTNKVAVSPSRPLICSTARLEKLEAVAERLRQLDWCIGYELTEEQYIELDNIRSLAYSISDDETFDFEMCDICEEIVCHCSFATLAFAGE